MRTQATGYAVMDDGELLVRTVSPTERGAKVNWLFTAQHVLVLEWHSEKDINSMFDEMAGTKAKVIKVEITDMKP